jgi:hypothetical protein
MVCCECSSFRHFRTICWRWNFELESGSGSKAKAFDVVAVSVLNDNV